MPTKHLEKHSRYAVTFVYVLRDVHWAAMSPVRLEAGCSDESGFYLIGVLKLRTLSDQVLPLITPP